MFLMCPLTLTSPSLCLLLIGHPWWLSHLVLKTVGCILSAQGPLGGYSSSSGLVLGGQGQSLCLSPCPSTLHLSLEFLPASPPRKWGTLALLDWNVGAGPSRCLNPMRNQCFQTRHAIGFARVEVIDWRGMRFRNTRVKIQRELIKGARSRAAFQKAGRCLRSLLTGLLFTFNTRRALYITTCTRNFLQTAKKEAVSLWLVLCRLTLCMWQCRCSGWPENMPVLHTCMHDCKAVSLALFGGGACPAASEDTVHLRCITLPLLPAHVCLRFLDGSPGPTDHTCGEREPQHLNWLLQESRNCPQKEMV